MIRIIFACYNSFSLLLFPGIRFNLNIMQLNRSKRTGIRIKLFVNSNCYCYPRFLLFTKITCRTAS